MSRIPIASTLRNRSASTAKDARLLNCFVENKGDPTKGGVSRVTKRPALVANFEALEGGAGSGQGLFAFTTPSGTSTIVGIQNDVLNTFPTSIPTRLSFTTQPSDWKIQTAMSPSIVVKAMDSFGGVATSFTGNVTLEFYANPNGGTLSGTLTVAAVAGVATFSNVKIDKVGGGYRLLATSGTIFGAGRNTKSNTFKIISNLSFTGQPTSTIINDPVVAQVSIVDSASAVITGYTGNVTLSLAVNLTSATLSGTLTKAAVNGVANFTDLSINVEGTYLLQATADSGGMATAYSDSFVIAQYILVAGSAGAQRGYKQDTGLGSLTPNTLNGATIVFLESKITATTNTALWTSAVAPQNFFTSITIGGVTLTSASATYTGATWTWTGTVLIPATGTYAVTFV